MLYQEIVDEELAIMEEETPDEPSKTLSPHEIHVPLHSLMYPPVIIDMGRSTQEAIDRMLDNKVGAILIVSGWRAQRDFRRAGCAAKNPEQTGRRFDTDSYRTIYES